MINSDKFMVYIDYVKWRIKRLFGVKKELPHIEEEKTFRKGDLKKSKCLYCGKSIWTNRRFCNNDCMYKFYGAEHALFQVRLEPRYIGLCNAVNNNIAYGEPDIESGYKRVQVMRDDFDNDGLNKIDFKFPEATGFWGKLTLAFLTDNEDVRCKEVLEMITLTDPRLVDVGDTAQFKKGALNFSTSQWYVQTDIKLLEKLARYKEHAVHQETREG